MSDTPWVALSEDSMLAEWQLFCLYRSMFKSIAQHEALRGTRAIARVQGREHFPYLRWGHFTFVAVEGGHYLTSKDSII